MHNEITARTKVLAAATLAAFLAAVLVALTVTAQEAQAAFPGQNGKIAYYRSGDVWTMDPSGANPTRITNDYNAEKNPAVSPDGSKIAYEFMRGVWVMNADGSGKKKLTDGAATDEGPAWSADGTKVAFSRGGDVWVMNASDGSGQTNLTNTAQNAERDPAWSPNGAKIAYTRNNCGAGTCIYVMDANGSGQTNLTPEDALPQCPNSPGYFHDGASRHPAWSPDGQKIAFSGAVICPHTIGKDIWVMNADGSGKTNLINDNGSGDEKPAFSPDGASIVFQSDRNTTDGTLELYTMSASGSGMTRITTNNLFESDPDWGTPPPADTTAPAVTSTSPAAGAASVSRTANATVAFSEAINPETLSTSSFTLVNTRTGASVPAAVRVSPDGETATLDPNAALAKRTKYEARVKGGPGGVSDQAGNTLAADRVWSFTTVRR